MTDQEIREYRKNHSSVFLEDLEREVINTSPQIIGVYHENIYDLITIVTPNNQFTFFRKWRHQHE